MTCQNRDIGVLRDLAKQYVELAAMPVQEERRKLWAAHFGLKPTRPPIIALFGMWNVWCREVFGDDAMQCEDPFFREHERELRLKLFHHTVGDDFILEPWITQPAVRRSVAGKYGEPFGAVQHLIQPDEEGGAYKEIPSIREWSDMETLHAPRHEIDEEETARLAGRLHDAVGDILEVDVTRGPEFLGLAADISTSLGALRGMEQVMYDMYECPEELHRLVAFLRDGILRNHAETEQAGHFSLTTQMNQAMAYADDLPRPKANSGARPRKDLWALAAAQEFTLVSPQFHEEFLFNYQLPIMEQFGLVHYGCCENLTRKIATLRHMPNLRSIAVTPTADVEACAEQIGTDYAISWRPSPPDMVCAGWNEARIRKIISHGLKVCAGTRMHINLKDIETLQGETDRLARWTRIVRELVEAM